MVDDSGASPLPPLGEPADHTGAETQARFRYQCEVAARQCIAMLGEGTITAVVCEWHEDYLVLDSVGRIVLASVKHREVSRGPWRLRELADDALATLYRRWRDTGRRAHRCLISTNGGLAAGQREAASFKAACHGDDPSAREPFARLIAGWFGEPPDEVAQFLGTLVVEDSLPGRHDIAASTTLYVLRPVMRQLRLDEMRAEEAYEAVVTLVEVASRQTLGSRISMFAYVNDPDLLRRAAVTDELLGRRTVTADAVLTRMREACAGGIPTLIPPPGVAATSTVMVQKLERGGLGPTVVDSAKRLRAIWSEVEARYRSGLPGADDEFEDLRTRVQALAADAEAAAQAASSTGDAYGPLMHGELVRRLGEASPSQALAIRLEVHHLRGLAYQLTDECTIWWSEPFAAGGPS